MDVVRGAALPALLFYCRVTFDWHLFLRFRAGLRMRGLAFVVVTNRLSVWLLAHLHGVPCSLLRQSSERSCYYSPLPENSVEYKLGLIDLHQARLFQNAVWDACRVMRRKYSVRGICAWNNSQIHGSPLVAYARRHELPTCFFELGNFGGTLFADPEGVNAGARLAKHPELLDSYCPDEAKIASWRTCYLALREAGRPPPQAQKLGRINWWGLIDWFGYLVLRTPRSDSVSFYRKIIKKISVLLAYHAPEVRPNRPYIFLPLQVSADSNLIVHSDFDNLRALEFSQVRAAENNCLLVVKPHPAETNKVLLAKIAALCAECGHLLTSYNTTELVQGAEEVITINSSVGLEALLLGKPVTMLGRSVFQRFSRLQAYAYVIDYLIDFAPFGKVVASAAVIDRILAVMGLGCSTQPVCAGSKVVGQAGVERCQTLPT